jgi:hypothetical protein
VLLSIVFGSEKIPPNVSDKPRMLHSLCWRDPQQPFCLAYIL